MPKEDCKYWDKCYQKNPAHIEKYNHPKKDETVASVDAAKDAPKRSSSAVECRTKTEDIQMPSGSKESKKSRYDAEEIEKEAIANFNRSRALLELMRATIDLSHQQEYDKLLESNNFLRHKFLVDMPPDFYAFWKFIEQLRPNSTKEELMIHMEKQFQLMLVGPFEFLAGKFHKAKLHEPGDYLRHWRFYYDPPEFQTIFVRKGSGVHYGYWRDDPLENETLLIARNDASQSYEFEFVAGNVFDAFLYYLRHDFHGTPFTIASISHVSRSLNKFIETNDVRLEVLEELIQERSSKVVCKTFHRAGIVVPFNRESKLGYRPLIKSDIELKKILKLFDKTDSPGNCKDDVVTTAVLEKLQPIATAATIALDECDFGTALELGIDLFCSGYPQLHMLINSLLLPAYSLLGRPQFVAISKAHLDRRVKSLHLSMFDYDK